MEFRIVKCNGKWEEKNNGTNRTAEHGMNLNVWIEEKRKVLGNIASEHHQKILHERKIKKSVYQKKQENFFKPCSAAEISSRDKRLCSTPYKLINLDHS